MTAIKRGLTMFRYGFIAPFFAALQHQIGAGRKLVVIASRLEIAARQSVQAPLRSS
jgi:hypothetical protein